MNFDHVNINIVKIIGPRRSGRTTELVNLARLHNLDGREIIVYPKPFNMYKYSPLNCYKSALSAEGLTLNNHVLVIDNFDYIEDGDRVMDDFRIAGCRNFLISIEGSRL